jgi:hypothetical protein
LPNQRSYAKALARLTTPYLEENLKTTFLKTISVGISALTLLVGLAAHADYNESGTSSVNVTKDSSGHLVIVISTTDFNVDLLYEDVTPTPILLKKISQQTSKESQDGVAGKLSVIARGTKKTTFDTILWQIQEDANDGSPVEDSLYLTWQFGCCDSATSYRALNVKTGKLLLSYDDHSGKPEGANTMPFVVEVPNSKPTVKRFLGILTESATRDFIAGKTADGLNKLATISYASIDGTLKKYDLFGQEPSGTSVQVEAEIIDSSGTGKNEIRANHLTLWTSDGVSDPQKALQGFAIKISVFGTSKVEAQLPFAADKLDLTRATLPAGFRILPAN